MTYSVLLQKPTAPSSSQKKTESKDTKPKEETALLILDNCKYR